MKDIVWNPWHGCRKYSEGCRNCYVYRRDESVGRDASEIVKNNAFDLPVRRRKDGSWKIADGTGIYLCMTSDFFIDAADSWRDEIWEMIRRRPGLHFTVITKRIARAAQCLPPDWGGGWDNFTICCTMENQEETDRRFPLLLEFPCREKTVICEPLLSAVDMSRYLSRGGIARVIAGGESGSKARVCSYEWILSLRDQCKAANVAFYFKQTGARFLKDGRLYHVPRKFQHSQARRANIDVRRTAANEEKLPWQTDSQLHLPWES